MTIRLCDFGVEDVVSNQKMSFKGGREPGDWAPGGLNSINYVKAPSTDRAIAASAEI